MAESERDRPKAETLYDARIKTPKQLVLESACRQLAPFMQGDLKLATEYQSEPYCCTSNFVRPAGKSPA